MLGCCDQRINELCESDKNLSEIKILRYRDDYRIFGHSDSACGTALKVVSAALMEFGMRLGKAKTTSESNLISGAVKREKIRALGINRNQTTLQKELLQIHDYTLQNPGAGAAKFLISEF